MASAANLDWLYHTLGWTFAAAGVVLLGWALFWDRSRGRRRCPKCWYSMEGVPGLRCPECGREAKSERSFFRTRSRYRYAMFALLVMAAGCPIWSVPRVRIEGWFGFIPSSALALVAPVGDKSWEEEMSPDWRVLHPPSGSLLDRSLQRLCRDHWWSWQSQLLLGRVIHTHPGEIRNVVQFPRNWPCDVPPRIFLNPGYATGRCGNSPGVRVRVHGSRAAWMGLYEQRSGGWASDDGQIANLPAGKDSTVFDVQLLDERRVVWSGTLRPQLDVHGTVHDYITGVQSREIDDDIRALQPRLVSAPWGGTILTFDHGGGPSCTLAVDISIRHNGQCVGSARYYRFNMGLRFLLGTGSNHDRNGDLERTRSRARSEGYRVGRCTHIQCQRCHGGLLRSSP